MGQRGVVRQAFWQASEVRSYYLPFALGHTHLQILARSLPMAVTGCAALAAAVGGFDYSGQLAGQTSTPEKKEERRKSFFKQPRPQPSQFTE